MKLLASLIRITAAGIVSVALLSVIVSMISGATPGKPGLFFILLALALIPIVSMIVGARAARASYFACRGPNESIAIAVAVALVSAVGGIVLWLLATRTGSLPDITGPITQNLEAGNYMELLPLLLVYALAGSIGGVFDYYFSQGRKCDIRRG